MGRRETEVRLEGWCECDLRQQRNDGGGCMTMCERSDTSERVGALVHMRLNEFDTAIFAWHCVLSDYPPMLRWLSYGERRDAVGMHCK